MVVSKVLAAGFLAASLWGQEADAGICYPGRPRTSLRLTRASLYPTDLPDSTTAVLASTAISSWTTDLDESTTPSSETSPETSSETIPATAPGTSLETSIATGMPSSSSSIPPTKPLTTLSISIIVPTSTPTSVSTTVPSPTDESTSHFSSPSSSSSSIIDLDETTSQASSTSQPVDRSSTTRPTFSLSQTSTLVSQTGSGASTLVSTASSFSSSATDPSDASQSLTSQFTTLRTSIATSTHGSSTPITQSTASASETGVSNSSVASSSTTLASSPSKIESSTASLHPTSLTSTRNTESTSTKPTTTTSTTTPTPICDPPNNLFRNPGFEQTSDGGASWNFGEAEVIEQKDTPSTDKEARPKTGKRYAQITALHQTLTSPGYIVQSDMKGAIVGKAYTLTYNWAFAMPKSSTLTAATCTVEVSDNNNKRWYQDIEYDAKEAFKYSQATVKIESMLRENPTFEFTIDCGTMEDGSGENLQLTAYIALDDFSLVETDNAGSCPAP